MILLILLTISIFVHSDLINVYKTYDAEKQALQVDFSNLLINLDLQKHRDEFAKLQFSQKTEGKITQVVYSNFVLKDFGMKWFTWNLNLKDGDIVLEGTSKEGYFLKFEFIIEYTLDGNKLKGRGYFQIEAFKVTLKRHFSMAASVVVTELTYVPEFELRAWSVEPGDPELKAAFEKYFKTISNLKPLIDIIVE
jgi:hypothetical protein